MQKVEDAGVCHATYVDSLRRQGYIALTCVPGASETFSKDRPKQGKERPGILRRQVECDFRQPAAQRQAQTFFILGDCASVVRTQQMSHHTAFRPTWCSSELLLYRNADDD